MLIRFGSTYSSIGPFDPVELPDFVVLTGLNGAGKSQLLEAIEKENVKVDDIDVKDIVRYSNDTFRIGGEPNVTGQSIANEALQSWNYVQQQLLPHEAGSIGITAVVQQPLQDNAPVSTFEDYMVRLKNFLNSNPNIRNNPQCINAVLTIETVGKRMSQIDRKEYLNAYKPFDSKPGLLQAELGKVFMDWRQKQIRNSMIKADNERFEDAEPFLTDAEFEAKYGTPPWVLIDAILANFNAMQYETTKPERADFFTDFKLQLRSKLNPHIIVDFESLSSGEKVLMALVALIYKDTHSSIFPKLVLLDEIDASLHPSMTRNLLSTLREIFQARGVKMMIVTHSPSTIALAPEDSIYVVNRVGPQKVEKRSRAEALRILTEGFATLEEGLLLFDQSTFSEVSIITEGKNTFYINEMIRHFGIQDVTVIEGLEAISGKDQLHVLFRFFKRLRRREKVIFVYDCDVARSKVPDSDLKTFGFIIPQNNENNFARNGIENLLPEAECRIFSKVVTIETIDGVKKEVSFDENQKRRLEAHISKRNQKSDFDKFRCLVDEIERVRKLALSDAP